jgi:hypothetical protein
MDSSDEVTTEKESDSEPQSTDATEANQPEAAPAAPSDDVESEAEAGREDHQFPDPSSLVAMAGMHLPTAQLIRVLLTVFDAHAWRSMGLVADHSGEVNLDLPAAQTSIDCLAFLLGKIETDLEPTEKRDIQRRLMDLRLNFVSKSKEA